MSEKKGLVPKFKMYSLVLAALVLAWVIYGVITKNNKALPPVTGGARPNPESGNSPKISHSETKNQNTNKGGVSATPNSVSIIQNNEPKKAVSKEQLKLMSAQKLAAAFSALTSEKSKLQQQNFFEISRVSIKVPDNFKSLHRRLDGQANMLFSYDPQQMISYKVIEKNGSVTDQDKQFLQDEVLGINLNDYEELDAKSELNLDYQNVKLYKGSKSNFMSYGVLIYDKATDKSVAVVFDGHPMNVQKNVKKMIDSIRSLKISP